MKKGIEARERFAQLFRNSGNSGHRRDFMSYFNGLPKLSSTETECCERPITVFETQEASRTGSKLPNLDGLPYKHCTCMPDLSGDHLANVYCNWQKNWRIHSFMSREAVMLLRKDLNKRNCIDNFWPITIECRVQNFGQGVSYKVRACLRRKWLKNLARAGI